MSNQQQYQALEEAIRRAGKRAQQFRKEGLSVTVKGRQDFVSEADVLVENELREVINALHPGDAFLGEEGGLSGGGLGSGGLNSSVGSESSNDNELAADTGIWVIDPIDGTTNYLQNMDYWCVSVAYVKQGVLELGFIYAPDRDEFFSAKRGEGACLNGVRLAVQEPEAGQAILGLGRSNRRPLQNYLDVLVMLDEHDIEYRRFGAGALMLAHVASGQVHGYYEAHLNSWDALAGILLIEEAGGRVSDFLGNNGLLEGNLMWAATPRLWEALNDKL